MGVLQEKINLLQQKVRDYQEGKIERRNLSQANELKRLREERIAKEGEAWRVNRMNRERAKIKKAESIISPTQNNRQDDFLGMGRFSAGNLLGGIGSKASQTSPMVGFGKPINMGFMDFGYGSGRKSVRRRHKHKKRRG